MKPYSYLCLQILNLNSMGFRRGNSEDSSPFLSNPHDHNSLKSFRMQQASEATFAAITALWLWCLSIGFGHQHQSVWGPKGNRTCYPSAVESFVSFSFYLRLETPLFMLRSVCPILAKVAESSNERNRIETSLISVVGNPQMA